MMSALPPELKKGREMPVTGKRLVTTATLANTWKANRVVMPTIINDPNLSRA